MDAIQIWLKVIERPLEHITLIKTGFLWDFHNKLKVKLEWASIKEEYISP